MVSKGGDADCFLIKLSFYGWERVQSFGEAMQPDTRAAVYIGPAFADAFYLAYCGRPRKCIKRCVDDVLVIAKRIPFKECNDVPVSSNKTRCMSFGSLTKKPLVIIIFRYFRHPGGSLKVVSKPLNSFFNCQSIN